MATQTGSIDLKAAKDASKKATNYVSDISNGILVHPENDTQNGVRITDMVDILRDDVSVMAVGERNLETGNDVIRIGKGGETRTEIDFHSLKLIDKEGTSYVWFSDLRDAEGYVPEKFIGDGETTQFYITVLPKTVIEVTIDGTPTAAYTRSARLFTFTTAPASDSEIIIKYELYSTNIAEAKAYTLGLRQENSPIGAVSMAEGVNTIASGAYSHAEGRASKAIGYYSHAEGHSTTAYDQSSHAEGYSTFASSGVQNGAAHAEGYETQAKAQAGHAEGYRTIAGDGGLTHIGCHAEGSKTEAYLIGAHAEGRGSIANEIGAHAQNEYTIASKEAQTALGTYNIEDTSASTTHPSSKSAYGKYAVIIGNGNGISGDPKERSNAFMVDWNGYIYPQATKMTDFIVEQGTSGRWTYRKWNSGVAECWAYFKYTSVAMTTLEGYGYYAPLKTENFPSGLFYSAAPVVTVGAELNGSLGGFTISTTSKTSMSGYLWATKSATRNVYLHVHAVGNWK